MPVFLFYLRVAFTEFPSVARDLGRPTSNSTNPKPAHLRPSYTLQAGGASEHLRCLQRPAGARRAQGERTLKAPKRCFPLLAVGELLDRPSGRTEGDIRRGQNDLGAHVAKWHV